MEVNTMNAGDIHMLGILAAAKNPEWSWLEELVQALSQSAKPIGVALLYLKHQECGGPDYKSSIKDEYPTSEEDWEMARLFFGKRDE